MAWPWLSESVGVAWPWLSENWKAEFVGDLYSAECIRVFTVLRAWFYGMEDGSAVFWQPDPNFSPQFTEEQVNNVVNWALDEWFNHAPNRNYAINTRGIWHDAGPDFGRLAFPQRLALCQQLWTAVKSHS